MSCVCVCVGMPHGTWFFPITVPHLHLGWRDACVASRNSILAFDNRTEHYYITRKCARCSGAAMGMGVGGERLIMVMMMMMMWCVVLCCVANTRTHTHTHDPGAAYGVSLLRRRSFGFSPSDSLPLNNLLLANWIIEARIRNESLMSIVDVWQTEHTHTHDTDRCRSAMCAL